MSGLAPGRVEPLLTGRFGRPYVHVGQCETTQLLLPADAPEGAVATADHQTAGRGREGRAWVDTPGASLLLSVLLRPASTAASPQLSLVCALAVAESVEEATARAASVKWPNDVLVDGRKVAGILLEGREGAVVCGLGVNVNQDEEGLPRGARIETASLLTLTRRAHDRARLLAGLLERLEASYDAWLEGGLAAVLPELERRDALRGSRVRVGSVWGTASGIAPDGRLRLVDTAGEELLVSSGEVVSVPDAS